ncbi:MAG TPA: prolyl oligopeptidase family serine peptidase [Chitinophagaceae bacterium]|nr:prolyl oligopeptidase family serine peptidase [Chitinophagaceae bacterium]
MFGSESGSLFITTTQKTFWFLTAFIIVSYSSKAQFGTFILEKRNDSMAVAEQISRIRSMESNPFEMAGFAGVEDSIIRYRLFKPEHPEGRKVLPLVLVFHGSGQIGSDNQSQLGLLAKLFAGRDIQKKYPAYVLAPQFSTRSSDYKQDEKRGVLTAIPRSCVQYVLNLIDSLKTSLPIDPKRIYAVGFSMGGSTVIHALGQRPDLFAAGISLAGIPEFKIMNQLGDIPIWLIHGMNDTENSIQSDERFYQERNKKILFWKLKSADHLQVFDSRLLGEALPQWLFQFRK